MHGHNVWVPLAAPPRQAKQRKPWRCGDVQRAAMLGAQRQRRAEPARL